MNILLPDFVRPDDDTASVEEPEVRIQLIAPVKGKVYGSTRFPVDLQEIQFRIATLALRAVDELDKATVVRWCRGNNAKMEVIALEGTPTSWLFSWNRGLMGEQFEMPFVRTGKKGA